MTLAALLLLAAAGLVLAAMVATHPDDTVVLMRTGARVDTSYVAPDRNQPSHAGNLPPATR